jgi:hypothetical protein
MIAGASLLVLAAAGGIVAGEGDAVAAVTLYADRGFYRDRPEPEEVFEGHLRAAPVVTGPDTRDLPFRLEGPSGSLPVYASGEVEARLRDRFGRRVRISGKRVDLGPDGGGVELWPGSVEP